jgi:hypothetical protein
MCEPFSTKCSLFRKLCHFVREIYMFFEKHAKNLMPTQRAGTYSWDLTWLLKC